MIWTESHRLAALRSGELRDLVARKSGGAAVTCDLEKLRSLLGFGAGEMTQRAFGFSMMQQTFNDRWDEFLAQPGICAYLTALTPPQTYVASGVRVLPLEGIRDHSQQMAPGVSIFWDGYLVVATSFHENAVCFHAPSGRVVWACYDSFMQAAISYQDRATGQWLCVPYTPENVARAVVPLSDDIGSFLHDLLHDKWQQPFRELD